jgi:hypothetical protein
MFRDANEMLRPFLEEVREIFPLGSPERAADDDMGEHHMKIITFGIFRTAFME